MKNGLIIERNGVRAWYHNDEYHRNDGPAVIYGNGSQEWHLRQEWWLNGKMHREDGPAIINPDGTQF